MSTPEGIIPPMVSSFDRDGEIDLSKLKRFINFLINHGVSGIFPSSTTGEFSSLTVDERKRIIETAIKEAGGEVPVLAGTGSTSFKTTKELTYFAQESGAEGAIIVTPYYLTPEPAGLEEYYAKIAEAIDIPIILYNIPQYTGTSISVGTVTRLERNYGNIVGIKDSSRNFSWLMRLKRKVSSDFSVYQGIDTLLLPSLLLGCSGGMIGSANVGPSFAVRLFQNFKAGNLNKCIDIQKNKNNPLMDACIQHGEFPGGFKEALNLRGIKVGTTRSPIQPFNSKKEIEKLRNSLSNLNLLD